MDKSLGKKIDLEYIHGLITKLLISKLEASIAGDEDSISPAEIQMVLKFLKDNDITCDISDNTAMQKLKEKLNDFTKPIAMPKVGCDEL